MRHGKRRQGKKGQARTPTASAASAAPATPTASAGAAGPAEAPEGSAGRVALAPWWMSEPGRLECELAELQAAGIEYELDERAKASGVIVINLTVIMEAGERIRLVARFPDVYPYVRFEVLAPDLSLGRHQNPIGKQLCLIGRDTGNWKTTSTLAAFIKERVPLVLRGARSTDPVEVAGVEEHQGEPFSDYYPYLEGHMLLVDGGWTIGPEVKSGMLTVGFDGRTGQGLTGAVLSIKDERGRVLAEAEPALSRLYGRHSEFRWVRCDEPVKEGDLNRFFDALYEQDGRLRQPRWRPVNGRNYDIIGVVFSEEQRWREYGDGWVFAVRSKPFGGTAGGPADHFLARAGRAGKVDLTERIPELRPLRDRSVALVGLGALGAPSAFELARCGVGELRILDHDYVDPSTSIRWPLGLTASGKSKAGIVAGFITENYPHTKVVPFKHRLGECRGTSSEPSDNDILPALLDGVHLVYDASAEIGLNHLLSDLAAARGIPYICVSTTHGAWGGRLIRVRPGDQAAGCWMCHQWGLIRGEIPTPPADPRGEVQPAGCSDPTFTGAGFDVAGIGLAGVRLAVSTLSAGADGSYPDVDWDIAVIHMRDDQGRLLTPSRWDTFPLVRHPECRNDRAHGR